MAVGGYVGQALSKADTGASDKIGIAAAVVILLLVFGSAVAMGLPIMTAVLGLLCGLSVDPAQPRDRCSNDRAHARDDDRARGWDRLLAVHRHQAPRTQVAEGMDVRESIARATATAGGAVLFAGGTVAIALLALLVAGHPAGHDLGYTAAIAVVFAILAALTLLAGPVRAARVARSAQLLPFGKKRKPQVQSPMWTRLATGITNNRWPVIVVVLGGRCWPCRYQRSPCGSGRRTWGRADRHDRASGLRPDHEGFRCGDERTVPDLRPVQQRHPREAGPEASSSSTSRSSRSSSSPSSSRSSSSRPRASRRTRPSSRSIRAPR